MTTERELAALWSVLGATESGPKMRTIPVEDHGGPAGVLLGIGENGHRHVLFETGEIDLAEDRGSQGVHLTQQRLTDGSGVRTYADLECLKPWLEEPFDVIVQEVLSLLSRDRISPVTACHTVLTRWRDLLSRARADGLGPDRAAGLVGELLLLRDLAARSPNALALWSGPSGSRHDFSNGHSAIEVKASRRRYGRIFSISGQEQLAGPEDPLYFCGVLLADSPEGELTVGGLLHEVLSGGIPEQELWDRVSRLGVVATDLHETDRWRFRLRERLFYRVDDDFPRIIPQSFAGGRVPPGILKVSYEIDLTGSHPAPLDDEQVQFMLAEFLR